jgi:hypothetical protein
VESEAAFEGSVGLECPGCGTNIIVMPARLYTAIGDLSGVEGELQFGEVVRRKKAETGDSRRRRWRLYLPRLRAPRPVAARRQTAPSS